MFTKVHRIHFNKDVTEEKLKEEILKLIKIDSDINNKSSFISDFFNRFLFLFGV